MARADARAAYERLPLPTTTDEHWRFTDLREFDPASFGDARVPGTGPGPSEAMVEIDAAGVATVTEAGVAIERVPDGITFAPLSEEHERLYSLVGWDEKFIPRRSSRCATR